MPRAVRTDIVQPDGRHVHLYGDFEPAPAGYRAPAMPNGVYQRRWNPLRREWVLVAASRQGRTFLPERADCPLCPSRPEHSSEIPAARFQAAVFENRFPAMVPWPPAGGLCEVVVYTDEHDGSFATLPSDRLDRLAEVWTDRYRELTARRGIKYVFIFENRGEEVGVTLHHPHGQIYAYPFVPPVAATELGRHAGGCLLCELVRDELTARRRVLINEEGIVAYVPESARWSYEVHVATRAHRPALPDVPPAGRRGFHQRHARRGIGGSPAQLARVGQSHTWRSKHVFSSYARPTGPRWRLTAHAEPKNIAPHRCRGRAPC